MYEFVNWRPAKPNTKPRTTRKARADPTDDFSEPPLGNSDLSGMDKSKRKYYNKRRRRMYGTDSEDENRRNTDEFIELKPEIVEIKSLHKKQEEIFFHDAFAYPWEKDKHYKMMYQLEKKYFPDECLDKAFLDPNDVNYDAQEAAKDEEATVFEEAKNVDEERNNFSFVQDKPPEKSREGKKDIVEKKVEDLFKCLKKMHNENTLGVEGGRPPPYLVRKNGDLPATWDGPGGTVLLVNKPKGWTSFTVCGKLRRLVKVQKVGHAGTLDPMATGLLIICIGKATKLVERYQGMIKKYSGVFRLGEATSTWDADSPVIQREAWEHIRDDDIKKSASAFLGQIWQVPPMFSAIKVGGERMYEKARRGETVELSPRSITIFEFQLERSMDDRQNLLFRVVCSKGTYIRSLCADLGKSLGTCAHMTALRRDAIGEFPADDAWDFDDLSEAIHSNYL